MPRVGPYEIPFPFTPYPLQEHAMTALREYLERRGRERDTHQTSTALQSAPALVTRSASSAPSSPLTTEPGVGRAASPPVKTVAVLESPTGTGKSHMLLNSVLSYLHEPIDPAELRPPHDKGDACISAHDAEASTAGPSSTAAAACIDAPTAAAVTPAVTSLEEALRQRRLADEVAQLRRERRARVRAQRRQLRRARTLMRLQEHAPHASSIHGEKDSDYLLAQDPLAWYAEHQSTSSPSHVSNGVSGYGARSAYAFSTSSSSSASSSASSASDDDDNEGEDGDGDAEGQLETALATLVPLRKPKAYFASRTHTQLRQLMNDLQHTAFAAQPLRARAAHARVTAGAPPHGNDAAAPAQTAIPSPISPVSVQQDALRAPGVPHRLTAVHVAGRQHLCLNARLRRRAGGSGERLNYLCREAMRYERSKEGRAHRRQHAPTAHTTHHVRRDDGGGTRGEGGVGLRDVEDVVAGAGAEDKGCVYCVESHLRSLMTFLRDERQQEQQVQQVQQEPRVAHAGVPSSASTSSIYTMERLQHLGRELQACPYLATRLLLRGADVVLVPYSYVLDEGQRTMLLGGVTTNPATAAEAAAVQRVCRGGGSEDDTANPDGMAHDDPVHRPSDGAPSLGSVLYHRRQRVTATAAFRRRRAALQQPPPTGTAAPASKSCPGDMADEEDFMWHTMARCAPPSFHGDILVFDEAHNIADQCRATSGVTVACWQLALAQRLVAAYVTRYESRLLTRNKQRLRELTRFLAQLVAVCERAAAAASGAASATTTRVWPFHPFLFEAGIDNVDVYAFLVFLVDSQLLMKVQGLVAHCLASEAAAAAAAAEVERARTAGEAATRLRGGRKRSHAGADTAAAAAAAAPHTSTATEASHASTTPFTTLLAEAVPTLANTTVDAVQVRTVVADALQRVEKLLCALYVSDNASTRVVWSAAPANPDDAAPHPAGRCGALKLIQLEPGLHTFAPLVREAQAVVLAGGTMQPLAFTCGPLLAPATQARNAAAAATGSHHTASPATLPVHLISEGHVVPAASVQVWALGKGPSGLRLELSQHALGLHRGGEAGNATGSHATAQRALAEVGCTLLNLARVLPPAGVICFFTSYDVMDNFVAVLHGTGYWDQITAVKRIFREARSTPRSGGAGGDAAAAAAAAEGSGDVLKEYQEWIGGGARTSASARRGAMLFAVMGGRLSEGINFADDLGRAVIVLGMPYANPSDAELQLTLQHIATTRLAAPASHGDGVASVSATASGPADVTRLSSSSSASPFTSPEEWGLYMDGMMRTVNQCIGRCIRHAGDYAVIILLDARYAERADVRRRVSAWLQPSMRVAASFGQCFSGVREFFASRQQ